MADFYCLLYTFRASLMMTCLIISFSLFLFFPFVSSICLVFSSCLFVSCIQVIIAWVSTHHIAKSASLASWRFVFGFLFMAFCTAWAKVEGKFCWVLSFSLFGIIHHHNRTQRPSKDKQRRRRTRSSLRTSLCIHHALLLSQSIGGFKNLEKSV